MKNINIDKNNTELTTVLDQVEQTIPGILTELKTIFLNGHGNIQEAEEKEAGDYVTESDRGIENRFKQWVEANYPGHNFLGEEFGESKNLSESDWLWAIDPIDGTNNFQSGNSDSVIVISLRYKEVPVYAVCLAPLFNNHTGVEFVARIGRGFWINGTRGRVSPINSLKHAMAVVCKLTTIERTKVMVGELWDASAGIHMRGSSVLEVCLVASGEFGISVTYSNGPHEWPAQYLFAKESGCIIGMLGQPDDEVETKGTMYKSFLIAANEQLYEEAKLLVHLPPPLKA